MLLVARKAAVSAVVCQIIVSQMAAALALPPRINLKSRSAVIARLSAHGFGSASISELMDRAVRHAASDLNGAPN